MSEPQKPETSIETPSPEASNADEVTQKQPPITRKHIVGVAMLALTLCVIIITPGIIADYNTAQFLKPPPPVKKHPNTSRWRDLIRRFGVPLHLKGKNGQPLQGWLFRPRRAHARLVMYLHDFGRDHRDGYELVRDLVENGLNVLVYDLRAHSKSAGKIGRNYRLHSDDHRTVLHYIKKLLPHQWNYPVATIGEGVGGSTALLSATLDGTFRYVIALEPHLEPENEIKERFNKMGSLILDLTKKRITRVGDLHYRRSSPLRNAKRLRDTVIRIYTRNDPSKVRMYRSFCAKTKGNCKLEFIQERAPIKWWSKMPRYRRHQLVQFLLQKFNIPRTKYRLALRPNPPAPRVKRQKRRKRPTVRKNKTKSRRAQPTKRRSVWRKMVRRNPRAVPRKAKKVAPPVRRPAARKAPTRRALPGNIVPPVRRAKRLPQRRTAPAPALRLIRPLKRPALLRPKPAIRAVVPTPRTVLLQPKKRPTPTRPTSQKTK
ncbi:MAG: hypothetical protein EP343_17745 [Deltaproteobacteria bacterium]|nr:MAG: hypothetical protein EP343_17745 [Deltaproteobacteria bacterium]